MSHLSNDDKWSAIVIEPQNTNGIDMIDLHNTNEIKKLWQAMQNKEDLLALMNKVLVILYGDSAKKLDMQHLICQSYSSNNPNRYVTFLIPKKKNGEFRTISSPCKSLKTIQQCLNVLFQSVYTPHGAATGFIPKRSIVDGAKIHMQQKYVYNIDLKDFFPSITSKRIFDCKWSRFALTKKLQA